MKRYRNMYNTFNFTSFIAILKKRTGYKTPELVSISGIHCIIKIITINLISIIIIGKKLRQFLEPYRKMSKLFYDLS